MSAYSKAVETDATLRYWRLAKNSGTENKGATAITLNGTASEATGPLSKGDEGATSFDGTNDFGQVALDLSAVSTLTVEFWLKWDVNGTNDDFALEHGANANSNTGFNFDWNNSTGGAEANTVSLKTNYGGASKDRRWTFPRPSAAGWHHIVAVLAPATTPVVYVDGAAVTVTAREVANSQSGNLANTTLNVMCRNGGSLFGAGDLAHLAVYSGTLSKARVEAHYAARAEEEGGEEKHSGKGAVSGTASAIATGSKRATVVGVVSGSAAAAATGAKTALAVGAVSAAASSLAIGAKAAAGSAVASVAGLATALGSKTGRGSAEASASPAAQAQGAKTAAGAGLVGGLTAALATGSSQRIGIGSVAGDGAALASGAKSAAGGGSVSAAGDTEASGSKHAQGSGQVSGEAQASAQGKGTESILGVGSGSVTGEAVASASGSKSAGGAGSVAGAPLAQASGEARRFGAGAVAASSSVSATSSTTRFGVAAVSGMPEVVSVGRTASAQEALTLRLSIDAVTSVAIDAGPRTSVALTIRPKTEVNLSVGEGA